IKDARIEPIAPTGITVESIKLVSRMKKRTKLILYWRPIVVGWNDDEETMLKVLEIGKLCDAIVFTGYYNKKENAEYFDEIGVGAPYSDLQRRKVMPLDLDKKVVE